MSNEFEIKVFEELSHVRETLAKNTALLEVNTDQLKEHMKRSAANEEAVRLLEKQLEPIRIHVSNVRLIARIGMWVLGSGGAIFAAVRALFR